MIYRLSAVAAAALTVIALAVSAAGNRHYENTASYFVVAGDAQQRQPQVYAHALVVKVNPANKMSLFAHMDRTSCSEYRGI